MRIKRYRYPRSVFVLSVPLLVLASVTSANSAAVDGSFAETGTRHFVTNVSQFRALTGADYLSGCDFRLTGVVTLVDADRDWVVLQDATGAVALNSPLKDGLLQTGQRVVLDGTNCSPLVAGFPDYPYHPSGWDIRASFEAPTDWGEYHLTRMRGYLCPPITGNYRFWIASDNSSELWLSMDTSPARIRRIASVVRFDWTAPHQWSKYPSQRSEPIPLKAGQRYYIEALQEQTVGAEDLSVGWQIPAQSEDTIEVIDGSYLTPWSGTRNATSLPTNGVLREYWTNFTAAHLTGMGGPRPFESALSVERMSVQVLGRGKWPQPEVIALDQPLPASSNYRWVQTDGRVNFVAMDEHGAHLEISSGQAVAQVRVRDWDGGQLKQFQHAAIRVEGVCEGINEPQGVLLPGLIWAVSAENLQRIETVTNASLGMAQPDASTAAASRSTQGFYGTVGVVTFNDRVFDREFIFVQEDNAVMRVNARTEPIRSELRVGRRVDLGGALESGKQPPVISPMFVEDLGQHSMPLPIIQPLGAYSRDGEGRWCEFEGVVHAVNSDDTLSIACKGGPVHLWLGRTRFDQLADYVDAMLRVRGVLLMSLQDTPLLLVPSRSFVTVEESPPEDCFGIRQSSVAQILSEEKELWCSHRVRVVGQITYRDAESLFVQDGSGGIRVKAFPPPRLDVGTWVQVVAFPALNGFVHTLTDPMVRLTTKAEDILPRELDLSEPLYSKQSGTLVQVQATLLSQKTNGFGSVLELQNDQRVFAATLASGQGRLPEMLPGSRVRILGVCNDQVTAAPRGGEELATAQLLASLNILLRHPEDVVVLSGPPWWTWQRTAALVGTLLTVLVVTLLWIHLLHRRLERQKEARLAFSRGVLERLEDERRRIAANLHDSLGQTLLVIKNHALVAGQSLPEEQELRQRLSEISGTTSQAIDEIRRITHGLRPYQLDRLGLTQAIRASVSGAAENSPIVFASRVEDIDGLFNKDAEINLYRIVQEAITNVVKHSAATEATVVIKKRAANVSLSIRDNGRGFDPTKTSSQLHTLGYGLSGIAERVRILGGTLTLESRPGEGTSLMVEVPLPLATHEKGNNSTHRG